MNLSWLHFASLEVIKLGAYGFFAGIGIVALIIFAAYATRNDDIDYFKDLD